MYKNTNLSKIGTNTIGSKVEDVGTALATLNFIVKDKPKTSAFTGQLEHYRGPIYDTTIVKNQNETHDAAYKPPVDPKAYYQKVKEYESVKQEKSTQYLKALAETKGDKSKFSIGNDTALGLMETVNANAKKALESRNPFAKKMLDGTMTTKDAIQSVSKPTKTIEKKLAPVDQARMQQLKEMANLKNKIKNITDAKEALPRGISRVADTRFLKDAKSITESFEKSELVKEMKDNPNVQSVTKNFIGRKTYLGIPTSVIKGQPYYVSPRKPGNSGPLPLP